MPTSASNIRMIYYRGWGGIQKGVEISIKKTGLEAKQQLFQNDKVPEGAVLPALQDFQLICKGVVIDNESTLESHGIKNWDTLMMNFHAPS